MENKTVGEIDHGMGLLVRQLTFFRCESGFTVTLLSSCLLDLHTGTVMGKMICFELKYIRKKLTNVDHSFARKLHIHFLSPQL